MFYSVPVGVVVVVVVVIVFISDLACKGKNLDEQGRKKQTNCLPVQSEQENDQDGKHSQGSLQNHDHCCAVSQISVAEKINFSPRRCKTK